MSIIFPLNRSVVKKSLLSRRFAKNESGLDASFLLCHRALPMTKQLALGLFETGSLLIT